ncbi:hypothetical protein [Dokdonia sp.]|uniref:hypothetical protein n=1 Tax=Dokdonia sp. TaxID=2024995 RepID=UPI003267A5C3
MSSTIKYLPIFNLNILHNYFLDTIDNGNVVVFDDTEKPEVLSTYNVSDFLRVVPSKKTQRVLKNHRVVFKTTTNGTTCFISVDQDDKPVIDATDVTVDLLIYSRDTLFEKYTDLETSPKRIYFFTNDIDHTGDRIDVLTDATATDLEQYKVLATSDKYEELLSALDGREQRSLLGIVSIKLDQLIPGGIVEDTPTELKIVLKNRKTIWVYLDQKDGSLVSQTGTPQPFMHKGNIIPRNGLGVAIPYRMATPSDAFAYQTNGGLPIQTQVYIYKEEEEGGEIGIGIGAEIQPG